MPSAANVKPDKSINSDNMSDTANNFITPLRQAITVMEHKIRNLEKRKARLDTYRELSNAGKELNADQKLAVSKYSEVIHTIEFAKEMREQFLNIALSTEKEAKKQARKEAAAKTQAELARLREILLVQDALVQMGVEQVREDFLQGRNGAAQLTDAEIKLLDDLYPAVTPKHEAGNPNAFTNEVQAAAEHLLAVVDGKPKDIFGGTYSQVKEILGKIHESGYFDQIPYVETLEGIENLEIATNHEEIQPVQPAPAVMEVMPMEVLPPVQQLVEQPPMLEPTLPPPPPPEQIYYQPPPPQPRPLTEVLGTGSFFFLQESEIDTPPEQIPTQTFTNPNYVTTSPPPPPPQTQTAPLPPPPASVQNVSVRPIYKSIPLGTVMVGGAGAGELPPPPQPTQPQLQQPPNGNGLEEKMLDNRGLAGKQQQPPPPQSVVMGPRPHKPHHNNNNQSYYQNNGYNRTKPQSSMQPQSHVNRNGPRSGNNPHNTNRH